MQHNELVFRCLDDRGSNVFSLCYYRDLRAEYPHVQPPPKPEQSKFKTDKQRVKQQQKKFTF